MLKSVRNIFTTALVFVVCTVTAQWKLDQISGEDGLSQNTIKSIIQDRNGFIWIANYHGIDKYDGYDMDHYVFSKGDDGLSSNLIHGLFEDKDGFIWAGTSDSGINRLDPRTGIIDKYNTTGIKSGDFRNIDKFFQSESGVLFYFTPNELRFFKVSEQGKLFFYDPNNSPEHSLNGINRFVRTIAPAKNGKHWLLTDSNLMLLDVNDKDNKLNVSLNKIAINTLFKKGSAVNMVASEENVCWIISNNLQLLKLQVNQQLEVVSKEYIDLKKDQFKIGNRDLTTLKITIDKNKKLWIAGDRILLNYDTNSGEKSFINNNNNYQINHKYFHTLLIDNSNILWLGSKYNGLFKIDVDNNTFLNSIEFLSVGEQRYKKFNKYPLSAISQDKRGNIWLGAQGNGGLAILNKSDIEQAMSNSSKKPWSLRYLNDLKLFKDKKLTNIRRFLHDSQDNLWVGSSTGLSLIKRANTKAGFKVQFFDEVTTQNQTSYRFPVFAIEEDYKKNIWIGLWGGGLVKLSFNPSSQEYEVLRFLFDANSDTSISDDFVRDIYEDKDGALWVGTVNGLNKIEEREDGSIAFIRYLYDVNNKNSLSNNHVVDIFQGKNGKIYVGTFGGGLNEITLKPNNKLEFKHFTVKEGLPSDVVYQINEDKEGNKWIMHVREISRLDGATGEISYFDKQDGFEIDEFKDNAMLKTASGMMLCGGLNGFTFFNPEKLSVNNYKPQITITDFKLFDESVKPHKEIKGSVILTKSINETDSIVLPYNLNSLEFTFSSLHYSNPEKNLYKFMLEGFEDKWQFSKGNERRFASYTNVPPGNYTFKVFGSNSVGIWTDTAKEIHVKINNPWYFTNQAILLYFVILISIIYLMIRIRSNQVRRESKHALDKAIHEKTDEMNRMKLQFFTNISHELRTPLTLIIGPLQQIMNGNTEPEYLKKLNTVMYKNSVRLLKLINQLLDFRKAETGNLKLLVQEGNLVQFVDEIYEAFTEIAIEKDIKFVFICEENNLNAWFDNDKIEKILYNLLSNAFKFTPRGKSIKIELTKTTRDNKPFAVIKVIDYGIGIPKDDLESVFERFYQARKEYSTIDIGSGLGLAYTKHLVEIHKGGIDIQSLLHEGTTCTFHIPISKDSYSKNSIIDSQLKHYDFEFTKNEIENIKENDIGNIKELVTKVHTEGTPTILIVEDNKELQNYLFNFFNNSYIILTADDGEEGLAIALKQSPNLIISDLMMPKMDGIEMCKKIKSDIRTSHIPVIILTAKAGLENEKESLETGADEFVLKPFNSEILKLRIENILRTKQQWIQKFKGSSSTETFKKLSNKLDQEFLEKCINLVKMNIENSEFSVEKFSVEMAMSRSALFKKIKSISGLSTSEFIRTIRLKRAIKFLKSGRYSITEIVFMVGFSDPKYFRTCFKKQFGKNPNEYLKSLK